MTSTTIREIVTIANTPNAVQRRGASREGSFLDLFSADADF